MVQWHNCCVCRTKFEVKQYIKIKKNYKIKTEIKSADESIKSEGEPCCRRDDRAMPL